MWPSEQKQVFVARDEAVSWRHVRVLPTRLGVGLLIMVGLLWLIGLNYQANLAYIAAFWLFGFVLVATLKNIQQLLGLKLEVKLPVELFSGVSTEFTVYSEGYRHRWLWLCLHGDAVWKKWWVDGEIRVLNLSICPQKRGYLPALLWQVASTAPFGISVIESQWQWVSDKIVYPTPIPHDIPLGIRQDESKEAQAIFAQSSDDLSYLKPHQEGTSLQHIAWKNYAKSGDLLDKQFDSVESVKGSHVISYQDYPVGVDKEQLVGWLCFRVLEAERRSALYELELPNSRIVSQKGQREMCLTALALW